MNKPKISVIVPIYKVEKYLVQCLNSIQNQTLKEIEVILIDEGDQDACRYIIDHYVNSDPRFIAIHEKNGGYGASVNKGFKAAHGEYVNIIESDDFILPETFAENYELAKKFDADVVVNPYYEYWDKKGREPERKQKVYWTKYFEEVPTNKLIKAEDYPQLLGVHPSIWAKLIKKSYLEENNIKCIEAKGAGYIDSLFRAQILCLTKKIVWNPKPYYNYRLSNENASTAEGQWNIPAAVKRWQEIHNWFDSVKNRDIKWDKFSSWIAREEFICTLDKVLRYGRNISDENLHILIDNLKYSNEDIANSKLDDHEKKVLKAFQEEVKDRESFNKFLKKIDDWNAKIVPTIRIKLFNFIPLILCRKKGKKWNTYLFDLIPILSIRL